jgi:phosphoribosylformylglycinamidine (FGAM) synthase-like amidotransferase family enzyme
MKARILTGFGIECEKESLRAFAAPELGLEVSELPVPFLLRKPEALDDLKAGDFVFFPGGFSFSDHFGSGRLLAHELKKTGAIERLTARGVHLMGVCNGFQVLASAGLFGAKTRLEHNEVEGKRLGFINRWVHCKLEGAGTGVRLPVRHGEGRLVFDGATSSAALPAGVSVFLRYEDFDNGSWQQIAGLRAQVGRSLVFGMMPHPEIALRPIEDPDVFGTDVFAEHRPPLAQRSAGGMTVLKYLVAEMRSAAR